MMETNASMVTDVGSIMVVLLVMATLLLLVMHHTILLTQPKHLMLQYQQSLKMMSQWLIWLRWLLRC